MIEHGNSQYVPKLCGKCIIYYSKGRERLRLGVCRQSMQQDKFYDNRDVLVLIIRIHHQCEARIEICVHESTVWHHQVEGVMTIGDHRG